MFVDNPMVVLGHRQGSRDIMDHMANNEGGECKLDMPVDLRDITFEKYQEISKMPEYSNEFSNIDDVGIQTAFANLKAHAKVVTIDSAYSVPESGFVNNCPMKDPANSRYAMDLGEINEQLRGLSIYFVKTEIDSKTCFQYSYDVCFVVLCRSRIFELYTKRF